LLSRQFFTQEKASQNLSNLLVFDKELLTVHNSDPGNKESEL